MVVQRPNDCEWVSRGEMAPDPPEGINGCRESEISLASGQPVIRLNGVDGLQCQVTAYARGMQREQRQRLPCQVVLLDPQGSDERSLSDNTHLAERVNLLVFAKLSDWRWDDASVHSNFVERGYPNAFASKLLQQREVTGEKWRSPNRGAQPQPCSLSHLGRLPRTCVAAAAFQIFHKRRPIIWAGGIFHIVSLVSRRSAF